MARLGIRVSVGLQRVCRVAVIRLLLGTSFIAASTVGWAVEEPPAALASGEYQIELIGNMVTIRAKDAPLEAVIRSLGERAGFQVTGALPVDEWVTVDIESQTLESSIRRLAPRYAAVFNESGQVRQLYLLPKGADDVVPAARISASGSVPEPFKFSFDPMEAPRRTE